MKRRIRTAWLAIFAMSVYTAGMAAESVPENTDRYSPESTIVQKVDLLQLAADDIVGQDEINSEEKPASNERSSKEEEKHVQKQAPVKVQADNMYYEDTSGYVEASGKVDIYRLHESLHGEKITGNAKTQQYEIPGEMKWVTPSSNLVGSGMTYDGINQSGTINTVEGRFDSYYVRGENGRFEDGVGYIEKGMVTTPSAMAKLPDYRIDGENIEIIPDDKMTVHNAKFYIKDKLILTRDKYVSSLKKDDGKVSVFQLIPRPGYESDYGFGVHSDFAYPINDRWDVAVNYYLYTELGFKPSVRVRHFVPSVGVLSLGYMSVESSLNDEQVWVRKWPEAAFSFNRFYLGDTGIYLTGDASIGDWEEGSKKGLHKGYSVRASHTPIKLGPKTNLRFFTGYMKDIYEVRDSQRSNFYYGATLRHTIMPGWLVYTTYVNNDVQGRTPYVFDWISIEQKGIVGTIFKIDRLNSFGVYVSRDLTHGEIEDINYTWYRDLHSFAATLTYKSKERKSDDRWEFQLWAKDFS